jgi:hypothetical protein
MALNAPIQGTAADIIKLAMIQVQDALDAAGLASQMLLQVHDEVILECPEAELDTVRDLVVEQMSSVADWPCRWSSTPPSARRGMTRRSTDGRTPWQPDANLRRGAGRGGGRGRTAGRL